MTRPLLSCLVALFLPTLVLSCSDSSKPPGQEAGAGGATGGAGTGGAATGGARTGGGVTGGAGTGGGTGGAGGQGGARDAAADAPTGGADAGPRSDGPGCNCGAFQEYRICCGDRCVNDKNDPLNCGGCGNRCPAERPFCEGGTCKAPPGCAATTCMAGRACCDGNCCGAGQICCSVAGPLDAMNVCYTPTAENPGCPPGCAPLCISDRARKRDIESIDPQEVLDRLERLPLARWRYREEPEGIRHLGPMAQDFRNAFGLGDSERVYHAVDAHGVAFAAIQALARENRELKRRLAALERRLER